MNCSVPRTNPSGNHACGLSNWFGVPDHISIDWLIFTLRTRLKVDLIHCHDISSALSPLSTMLIMMIWPSETQNAEVLKTSID